MRLVLWHAAAAAALVAPIRHATVAKCRHRTGPPTCRSSPAVPLIDESTELLQVLSMLESLPDDGEQERGAPPRGTLTSLPTALSHTSEPTRMSLASVRNTARQILAQQGAAEEKLAAIAQLSNRALLAGRVRSALAAYELGEKRVRKWRASRPDTPVPRQLVRAGLLAAIGLRDQRRYEELLTTARQQWRVKLTAERTLLSDAAIGCCEAGWVQHAAACNLTLSQAGLMPTTRCCNAMMAARLERSESDEAIDIFVRMRKVGPKPDRETHALATRAAAARKESWGGLRNLLRRNWFKVPWNRHSANAAVSAFIRIGNMRAAAGAIGQMQTTGMPLRTETLEALLAHASRDLDSSSASSLRVFSAIQQRSIGRRATGDERRDGDITDEEGAPALTLGSRLLMLPRLSADGRMPFAMRALEEDPLTVDSVTAQAALALVAAADGRGVDAAGWLRWLHAEGVALEALDADGRLCRLVDGLVPLEEDELAELLDDPPAPGEPAGGGATSEAEMEEEEIELPAIPAPGLKPSQVRQSASFQRLDDLSAAAAAAGEGAAGEAPAPPEEEEEEAQPLTDGQRMAARLKRTRRTTAPWNGGNVWLLALRACGEDVDAADRIIDVMEEVEEATDDPVLSRIGTAALTEYLGVCRRAADPDAALCALRRLGEHATVEAYVHAVITCCADEAPNMAVVTATLSMMDDAGCIGDASAGQLLRLYVGLVGGYGRMCDLDSAHAAFEEGREWLEQLAQQSAKAKREAEKAAEGKREAAVEGEAGPRAGAATDGGAAATDGGGWDEQQWRAAERALHRAMVDAAAPHPRGLLLACTLLEELARAGQKLGHGYYRALISGHATAHELNGALSALQGVRRGPSIGATSWRVSDATIGALIAALNQHSLSTTQPGGDAAEPGATNRARKDAIETLRAAGISLDHKVASYLASGGKVGRSGKRFANANDELWQTEEGGSEDGTANGATLARAAAAQARGIDLAGVDAWSRAPLRAEATRQYQEFEELLKARPDGPRPDGTLPERDTKRAIAFRTLRNRQVRS